MDFNQLLRFACENNASDIHIVIDKPPMVRIRGEICALEGFTVINAGE